MSKYVYEFGGGSAEGAASDKNLLGGKGANLAEMCSLGIPVPAGFTVSTECCTDYYAGGCKLPPGLTDQVLAALKKTETIMGMTYGDAVNPLLLSCRSGARSSMPGMMDTVLNVGLSTATIPGIIAKTNNPRFVWDSYRRLIMMYADVVMEKAEGLEPAMGKGIRKILDEKLDEVKHAKGCKSDTDLGADDLKALAEAFKELVQKNLGKPFPDDPMAQMRPYLKVGTEKRPSPTAALRAFRTSGAPPSTSRRWCSATWATPPRPVWPSPATRPPATTSSTASGW
jgi:pyruvate,orthophosphate dikinase